MFQVYIVNLSKYLEDRCIGQWIDLPISESNFRTVLKIIGANSNNYFFKEYLSDIDDISNKFVFKEEYSIKELNEIIKKIIYFS